jgi:hypothetical protein
MGTWVFLRSGEAFSNEEHSAINLILGYAPKQRPRRNDISASLLDNHKLG